MQFELRCLQDVILMTPNYFQDLRGHFAEVYNQNEVKKKGIDAAFVQDNFLVSKQGVLRGLHFQHKHPQGKLIWAVRGAIFDVAVDLRRSSPTFGKYNATILSERNRLQLWIPPGFAHGYYVMSKSSYVIYKTTEYYDPASEIILIWNDAELQIKWPLINGLPPLLSEKDVKGVCFRDIQVFE